MLSRAEAVFLQSLFIFLRHFLYFQQLVSGDTEFSTVGDVPVGLGDVVDMAEGIQTRTSGLDGRYEVQMVSTVRVSSLSAKHNVGYLMMTKIQRSGDCKLHASLNFKL